MAKMAEAVEAAVAKMVEASGARRRVSGAFSGCC